MLNWKDGLPFSDRYGDVYFSADSGLEEKRHVFLQGNNLAERFAALSAGERFCIAETGFGTGLNFLCAWQMFEQTAAAGASLDFFSVERFPLNDDELRAALALWPRLHSQAQTLLARWPRRVPGWNRWRFAGGRVRLTLAIADVAETLPQLPNACADAWFLDGFSPAKNPEMWSDGVLENIARTSRTGATLATYTSAGWVRRGLQQVGFEVERSPGFGRKREMLKGELGGEAGSPTPALPRRKRELKFHSVERAALGNPLPPGNGELARGQRLGEHAKQSPAPNKTPRSALIIGGGIAGCAAAHALAQRGITVTLVDSAQQLASAASGNPRGILHARFGAGDNPMQRFVLAAYGHALGLLDEVLPVDGVIRAECGLLQLACNETENKRIERLAQQEWPAHLLQFVDAQQATQLAGVAMSYGGLWFPAGGWVVPPKLCAVLAANDRITQRLGHAVGELKKSGTGWRVSGQDTQGEAWSAESEIVVVCCAHAAKRLAPFADFPLSTVRGQISMVPQTASSKALQAVVCGDGYCAPAVEGAHVTGATHAFDDQSIEVRAADHAENLAHLAHYAPHLRQALGEMDAENMKGRASLRCSAPGSMPLVGEVQQGLYCSLAHGTRGLLSAGLAGEVLAARICGQLPPLPVAILAALAPLPRVGNKG